MKGWEEKIFKPGNRRKKCCPARQVVFVGMEMRMKLLPLGVRDIVAFGAARIPLWVMNVRRRECRVLRV